MTRLLIVDDDQQLRESLVRDLSSEGYAVSGVGSVDDALALIEKPDPNIDVLLTDLRMPSRDGFDLLEVVREKLPRTRCVLISAFASARDYDAALERGAVAVVSKPFSRAELHAAVLLAIECGTGIHGSLHGVSFLDVLQLYHLGRRSVEVHLVGAAPGMIALENGEMIHAECGGQTGREALLKLLRVEGGTIRTRPRDRKLPHTLSEPFQHLVLDSMRTADEDGREADFDLGGFDDPTAKVKAAPPVDTELAARWRLACNGWGKLPAGVSVFAVGIAARRALEEEVPQAAVEQTLALQVEAAAASGGALTGSLEIIVGQLGLLLLWDSSRDALLALVQDISARNAPAYFRARAAFLGGKAREIFKGAA
ncbi:MAG TPA: response regulator [Myxococcales bacterium]|nr:response regulator [Myxococcales bacterium]